VAVAKWILAGVAVSFHDLAHLSNDRFTIGGHEKDVARVMTF